MSASEFPSHDSVEVRALSPALAESEELHRRVRTFAELAFHPPLVSAENADDFSSLALRIADFQARHCEGFRRLLSRSDRPMETPEDIPAVTVDTFRLCRVACHPPELDSHLFSTSGTTAEWTGRHAVRAPETFRHLALLLAERTLFAEAPRAVVVALAERPTRPSHSSLGLMMQLFMERFDGQALLREPEGAAFDLDDPGRWLVRQGLVDLQGLKRVAAIAKDRGRPLVLLCTGFALAATLEALDGERIKTPKGTTLMLTGGMKGRRTTLSESDVRKRAQETFCIDDTRILGEYGMTELTSQLYESPAVVHSDHAGRRDRGFGWWPPVGHSGYYCPPPWLRVWAVDPGSGRPLPAGSKGLAQFCDLGNIDSALVVRTQDEIVVDDVGIRLLGRSRNAPSRGCSLPFEGLVSVGGSS